MNPKTTSPTPHTPANGWRQDRLSAIVLRNEPGGEGNGIEQRWRCHYARGLTATVVHPTPSCRCVRWAGTLLALPNALRFCCGGLRRPPPSQDTYPARGRRAPAPVSNKRGLGSWRPRGPPLAVGGVQQ